MSFVCFPSPRLRGLESSTRFPNVSWYHSANPPVDMPLVWCKRWGLGRVYYNSLGHQADIFQAPAPIELMRRGFRWAAGGRAAARSEGATVDQYLNTAKMF